MRVLIAHGSKRGGTAGLATMIAGALATRGIAADVRPAREAGSLDRYGAVIVAGSLYANRWHRDARRFVRRHADQLRDRMVWLVSSGPLDDSAEVDLLAPIGQVARLGALVGARGMLTFGGRLTPDVAGFPASAMARTRSGDWRDRDHLDDFAESIAAELATHPESSP